MALDVDSLTKDQMEQLNICGTQFGMGKEDFIKYELFGFLFYFFDPITNGRILE